MHCISQSTRLVIYEDQFGNPSPTLSSSIASRDLRSRRESYNLSSNCLRNESFGKKEQAQPLISQQRIRDVSGYQTRTQRSRVTCTQDCTLPVDRSIIVARVCETRDWNVYQSFQDRLNAWYVNTFPIDLPKIAWLVLGPPGFPGCLPP